jgi:predicted MFS family arabinose efflux permease
LSVAVASLRSREAVPPNAHAREAKMTNATDGSPHRLSRRRRVGLTSVYPALSISAVRTIWFAMVPSVFAFQVSLVASGFAAVTLTRSSFAVGLVGAAWGLPILVLPIVGGVVADRSARRTIALATHVAMGIAAVVIAVLASWHALAVWHLVVFGLIQGVAYAFLTPARVAYTAHAVPTALMPNAIAAHYGIGYLTGIVGPGAAGVLLALPSFGLGWTYALIAGLYGLAFLILTRLPEQPVPSGNTASGVLLAREGLGYVRSTPSIRALLMLGATTTFFGLAYLQLMPLFAERVFAVGSTGLGFLYAASGLGALVGSLAATRADRGLTSWQAASAGALGVALIAFGQAPTLALGVLAVSVVGFASAIFAIVNNGLVMTLTDARMYSRVASVYQLTFGLGPLGAIVMGAIAERLGAPAVVSIGGAVVLAVILAFVARGPSTRVATSDMTNANGATSERGETLRSATDIVPLRTATPAADAGESELGK